VPATISSPSSPATPKSTSKSSPAPQESAKPLTGYIRGGVTVFGAKKPFPVFADETIELFDQISVSAGIRGTQLILNPSNYLRAAEAKVADLTKDAKSNEAKS
jgi:Cys-tRNA(Pro)/Cys-tRNA(Cys) deacylase